MKVAFHTLGCKVNSYETQAILEQFAASGFDVVEYSEEADVYVVNTCSVTGEAARKSRQILNRARKNNPEALTVVTGCYAQEDAESLKGAADVVIGNNEKSRIVEIALERLHTKSKESFCLVDDLTRCETYEEQEISEQGSHVRAYVKIQDGCNRFCAYCIIPYLRGRSRSRDVEDILNEVNRLVASGYKEIVITGIDISDFKINGENGILQILKKLDEIKGLERVRLGSLEEGILTEDFIKEMSKIKKLCPQFHLSLQSGSDSVLKRMNRKYTTDEYRKTVENIRKYFDAPAITTDVIVGFPGETEEEFDETLRFAEEMAFSTIHVFKYSKRRNTVAEKMDGQLTDRVKSERSDRLIKKAEEMAKAYQMSFMGKKREVLFEEKETIDGKDYYKGFTPEYFKIKKESNEDLINHIICVELKEEDLI